MKDFLTIAQERYSTKKYDASKVIPQNKIEELLKIARLSPSSINSQPWHFTMVSDKEIKNKLAESSFFNAAKIKEASHLMVFSSMHDIDAFEKLVHTHLAKGSKDYYENFLKGNPAEGIRTWLAHQVYISLGFVMAAAYAMGIDSTPMEGIEPEKYKAILGLENHKPLFALSLGYRHPEDTNQPSHNPKSRIPMEEIATILK